MESSIRVVKEENGICTFRVSGVLDYSTMNPFIEEIQSIEIGTKKVIVHFDELEFIDSTGIGAIINLVHDANAKNFKVEFQGINEEIEELFDTIGVFQIMEQLKMEEA
ncbi:STAS domain-containing protein [Aquibacillus sp. 3ASR75-11]|uniref:STAS domain-containing protein n=1 Tax=Terrihalobacillus insolitus TaxID=2950438 RepID=A0A9X3WUE5_9BACI|nr:STAS domain-containing protein [Terrihalobacillus insolitus]MDC3414980.1 STAS domain-containing protein [Terrihalobacillus insolitus]MDC3425885.1 STAS domain-containing protein [Terrihalobacillus insolitus]